ncbi:hypothetical protein JCM8547_008635 [Rhodosporidiobolus lusitaniae]
MPILSEKEQIAVLATPAALPCGLVLPNRLVKAAMEEGLGTLDGKPTELNEALYEVWRAGEWGMLITGNVQVDPRHLGSPVDSVVPSTSSSSDLSYSLRDSTWASWARAAGASSPSSSSTSPRPILIMQLNHPGRQSLRLFHGRSFSTPSLAPSSVPLSPSSNPYIGRILGKALWGIPKEMSREDIEEVVEGFVRGAKMVKESGWDGVQLHASHGYLLAQFMSPKVNLRNDEYGGSARKRLTLLSRIIDAIRAELPQKSGFCLGVKLNSSDYVKGGLTEQDALDNIKWIAEHGGVDFIEISGGSYESPEFMSTSTADLAIKGPSSAAREAFFDTFSHRARWMLSTLPHSTLPTPAPLILLTGGFRTRLGMTRALHTATKSPPTADLIGLGRPAAADPLLPLRLLSPAVPASEARSPIYDSLRGVRWLKALLGWIAVFGPGLDVSWHMMAMRQVALRRREEKRKRRELYGEEVGEEGEKAAAVRAGDAYPLSNFWVLAWRVYVASMVPSWLLGMAGAVVVAIVGKTCL